LLGPEFEQGGESPNKSERHEENNRRPEKGRCLVGNKPIIRKEEGPSVDFLTLLERFRDLEIDAEALLGRADSGGPHGVDLANFSLNRFDRVEEIGRDPFDGVGGLPELAAVDL
jgi:hypothetical protein